jgi:hypothetical protein
MVIESTDRSEFIPLTSVRAHVIGDPSRSTVLRWASQGIHRGGEIIRLRSTLSGGRRYTTLVWIEEFMTRCNGGEPATLLEAVR